MKKLVYSLIMVLLLFSCNKSENEVSQTDTRLPDSVYEVYGALLYPLSSINVVISTTNTNLNCEMAEGLNLDSLGITSEVINACKTENETAYSFELEKLLSGGLQLVSRDEVQNAESMTQILAKYGAISAYDFGMPVFFSHNGVAYAIFEMSRSCGPWCGDGAIITVSKTNGVWGNKKFYGTWISK